MPFRRKAAIYSSRDTSLVQANRGLKDYASLQTSARRHQFTSGGLNGFLVMAAGFYGIVELLAFNRTFTAANDTPPTATQSNNFQSTRIMNGSRVGTYKCVVNLENNDAAAGHYLDIYEVTVSFWDVFIWNSIFPSLCPFVFELGAGPPDIRGQITFKTITATLVVENAIKGFKFLQHFMRKRGTIYIGALGQANNKTQIILNQVPPKCKRANSGMYWGLICHNNSDKNASATINLVATAEYDFLEYPSEERLPYIN